MRSREYFTVGRVATILTLFPWVVIFILIEATIIVESFQIQNRVKNQAQSRHCRFNGPDLLPVTIRTTTSLAPIPTSSTVLYNRLPILDQWKVLTNGRVVGTVKNHPTIPDGDIITTSPILRPDLAERRKIVSTASGSKYLLGVPGVRKDTKNKTISIQELQKRSRVAFELSKDVVGDDTRQYLLAGKPTKSTSGKSTIYKAFASDDDGLPIGEPLAVKMSTNWEALEREADNYARITKAGLLRGQFVSLLDFLPTASIISKKFISMSALVMERGVVDLKRYVAMNGKLEGKELRDAASAAAQCIQAIHGSGLVWTDMKTENFVVTGTGEFKGIDLESAMPVKDNPVDYSPEGTPPEFARAFLAGEGPYFILQYNYDIWSLGMLFYELSTGKGYFDGKSPVQITKTLRDGPIIDLSAMPDVQLRDLTAKCLQLDPKKRPSILQVLLHPYFLSTGFGPFAFNR
jgi:serine/threonine protein kinase